MFVIYWVFPLFLIYATINLEMESKEQNFYEVEAEPISINKHLLSDQSDEEEKFEDCAEDITEIQRIQEEEKDL